MDDKPAQSACTMNGFYCAADWRRACVYAERTKPKDMCKHQLGSSCCSSVAKANAMIVELKRMGLEVEIGASQALTAAALMLSDARDKALEEAANIVMVHAYSHEALYLADKIRALKAVKP